MRVGHGYDCEAPASASATASSLSCSADAATPQELSAVKVLLHPGPRNQPAGSTDPVERTALDRALRPDPRLPRRSSDVPQRAADHFGEEGDCGTSIFASQFEAIFRKTLGFMMLVVPR
jgi:hypothetical protein